VFINTSGNVIIRKPTINDEDSQLEQQKEPVTPPPPPPPQSSSLSYQRAKM
jgi:hypothetical protein